MPRTLRLGTYAPETIATVAFPGAALRGMTDEAVAIGAFGLATENAAETIGRVQKQRAKDWYNELSVVAAEADRELRATLKPDSAPDSYRKLFDAKIKAQMDVAPSGIARRAGGRLARRFVADGDRWFAGERQRWEETRAAFSRDETLAGIESEYLRKIRGGEYTATESADGTAVIGGPAGEWYARARDIIDQQLKSGYYTPRQAAAAIDNLLTAGRREAVVGDFERLMRRSPDKADAFIARVRDNPLIRDPREADAIVNKLTDMLAKDRARRSVGTSHARVDARYAMEALLKGRPVPDLAVIKARLAAAGQDEAAAALATAESLSSDLRDFAKMAPSEQREAIERVKARGVSSAADNDRLDAMERMRDATGKALVRDPLGHADDVGVIRVDPIDWSGDLGAQLADRRTAAEFVGERYGIPGIQVLREEDYDSLDRVLSLAGETDRAALLKSLGSALQPREFSQVLSRVEKTNPRFARAAAEARLTGAVPDAVPGERSAAEDALQFGNLMDRVSAGDAHAADVESFGKLVGFTPSQFDRVMTALERATARKEKQARDLAEVQEAVEGRAVLSSADQSKFDAWYEHTGRGMVAAAPDGTAELMRIMRNARLIPTGVRETLANRIENGSGDAQEQAAAMVARIESDAPRAYAQILSGTKKMAAAVNGYVSAGIVGEALEKAMARDFATPGNDDVAKMRLKAVDSETRKQYHARVKDAFDSFGIARVFSGNRGIDEPRLVDQMLVDYDTLLDDGLVSGLKPGVAHDAAMARIKGMWGVTSVTGKPMLIKHPPEWHAPSGSDRRMREDLLSGLPEGAGDVRVISDRRTESDLRSGLRPSYAVWRVKDGIWYPVPDASGGPMRWTPPRAVD
jgi:hypothetical protein